MILKISNLFIWWNGQTLGTLIYTRLFGKFVGKDNLDNRYYLSKDGKKRWVIYSSDCDASLISTEWYSWMHKTSNELPEIINNKKTRKKVVNNFNSTSTAIAYHPNNSDRKSKYTDYIPWKPTN